MGNGAGNPSTGAAFSSLSGDVSATGAGVVSVTDLSLTSEAQGDIARRGATAWERVSAKTAGQVLLGDGTDVISAALSGHVASVSSAGSVVLADSQRLYSSTVSLTTAILTNSGSGQLGHTDGVQIIAATANKRIHLDHVVVRTDYGTAALSGGGGSALYIYTGSGWAQMGETITAAQFTTAQDLVGIYTHLDDFQGTVDATTGFINRAVALRGSAFTVGASTTSASITAYYRLLDT